MNQVYSLKGLDHSCDEKDNSRLLELSLSLSRLCNMRCLYCFTDGGKARDGELSTSERKGILSQAAEMGTKTWYIAGDGEPLLDRDLPEMVDYANNLGLYVVMFTNGTPITKETVKGFKDQDISVIVKWNALDPEVFRHLTDHHNIDMVGHDGVCIPRSLSLFITEGFNNENPTRIGIETVVTNSNESDIPTITRFCGDKNIYPHIEKMLERGRAVDHPEIFPATHETLPPHLMQNYCSKRPHYSMYVRSDGEAYVCFVDNEALHLGSIREHSLDVLVSLRDKKVRELLEQHHFPSCLCSAVAKNDRK